VPVRLLCEQKSLMHSSRKNKAEKARPSTDDSRGNTQWYFAGFRLSQVPPREGLKTVARKTNLGSGAERQMKSRRRLKGEKRVGEKRVRKAR